MYAFMSQHGPYVMEEFGHTFQKNDHSWNNQANVLYMDSPAGVGYSYCDDQHLCKFDDYTSADDNLLALQVFYQKFPEFLPNDLYLSGSSYAGVYVPFLAWKIDTHNQNATHPLNLKGLIVGNGYTHPKYDCNYAFVETALFYGLYGPELAQLIEDNHCLP